MKWDRRNYVPEKISAFWRAKLDRKIVAKTIETLASES